MPALPTLCNYEKLTLVKVVNEMVKTLTSVKVVTLLKGEAAPNKVVQLRC